MFESVEFMTAKEKQLVLNIWKRFIKGGFQPEHFKKRLYEHLHLHCGFIAHYNLHGFYETYFPVDNPEIKTFMGHFDRHHRYFDRPMSDYVDLNTAMVDFLEPLLPKIYQENAGDVRDNELSIARAIFDKHGVSA